MALTIPSQFFGTVAFALTNTRQPEIKNINLWNSPVWPGRKIKSNKMKKIFTLVVGLMLTVAMFAADRKPTVTVTSAKRYAIVIDGKRYFSEGNTMNISGLYNGRHDVQVYRMKRGFFMNTKRLVASSSFRLNNSDVKINIDRFGQLQISESRFGRDWDDHDFGRGNDRDHDHSYGRGDHDGRF